jgi:DNA-binding PucR family transcriptional regulator
MSTPAASSMREIFLGFAEEPGWLRELAGAMTGAAMDELPELAGDEISDALQASVESNVRLVAEMLRSGVDPAEATPPPAAVEYARELVRRGMSIDLLLRAYFVGHAAFFRTWIERVEEEVEDATARAVAIEEASTWTFAFVQALTRGIVERYTGERERWVRSAVAVKAEIVRALLAGERVDAESASTRLRYALDREHLAFLVWAQDGGDPAALDPAVLERAAAELVSGLGSGAPLLVAHGTNMVAGWVGSREGLAVPAAGVRGPAGACAAFGSPGSGVAGFRSSHRQALHARRVALMRGGAPGSLARYRDEALAALASADPDHARDFVAAELGPLAGRDETSRRLAGTLRVYLEENASPRRAAHRLGVHENTIANRVRAAEELLAGPVEERTAELLVALRLAELVDGR